MPLFIKRPGQQRGRVTAANVETIDVLPTLAAAIGVRPPWETDGENVLAAGRPQRPSKTMFLNRARDRLHGPGDLGAAIAESVAHKFERFEAGDPARPRLGEYGRIVGMPVADLLSDRLAHFEVVVDDLPALREVDPHADFVPARLIGGIVLRDPNRPFRPSRSRSTGWWRRSRESIPFRRSGTPCRGRSSSIRPCFGRAPTA